MNQRRLLRFYRLIFWLVLLFVAQQSLTPKPAAAFAGIWDKQLHCIAWFGVSIAAYMAYGYMLRRRRIIVGIFGLAVLVECGQLWVPGRTFSLFDIVANGTGCVIAGVAIILLERWLPDSWQQRLCGLQRRSSL